MSETSEAPQGAAESAASSGAESAAAAQARAAELRQAFEQRASAARDWANDQSDVLRDTVQTKPFISIGVSAASAFAAGLVLGVLLTRR